MTEPVAIKYRAFISYSHRDKAWAKWLHAALEGYRVDKELIGRPTSAGPVPKSLRPIFRDRDDFSAGHSLTAQTIAALEASQFLIVICSPDAAKSPYVNEEVWRFKAMGRADRVIPVIVDGEPNDPQRECFPPALRFKLAPNGALTNEREEPIAADARRDADGKDFARHKVVAALLGLGLDEIVRRADRARRRRNRLWGGLATIFLMLALAASGSAVVAYQKYIESEDRLDKAIEAAYVFAKTAVAISDRVGVAIDVKMAMLEVGELSLKALPATAKLRHRLALTLINFSNTYSALGKTAEALQRSREAYAILSEVGAVDGNRNLHVVHAQIGDLLMASGQPDAALDSYRASLAAADEFIRGLAPDDDEHVELLIRATRIRLNIGNALVAQGRSAEATETFRSALDTLGRFGTGGESFDLKATFARYPKLAPVAFDVMGKDAHLQWRRGEFSRAQEFYKFNFDYWHSVAARSPNHKLAQEQLVDAYYTLGNILLAQGLIAQAADKHSEGLMLARRLYSADPNNVASLRTVALLQDAVGRTFLAQGAVAEALDIFRANLDSGRASTIADRDNALWQSYLAIGHERVADAQFALGQLDEALREYRNEESILTLLVEAHPLDVDFQARLADCRFKIGTVLRVQGAIADAVKNFRGSLDIRERLVRANPEAMSNQFWRQQARWWVAEATGDTMTLSEATKALQKLKDAGVVDFEFRQWLLRAGEQLKQARQASATAQSTPVPHPPQPSPVAPAKAG